jgi:hypothetical protein
LSANRRLEWRCKRPAGAALVSQAIGRPRCNDIYRRRAGVSGNDVVTDAARVNGMLGVTMAAVARTAAGEIFMTEMMVVLRHSRFHHLSGKGQDGQDCQYCPQQCRQSYLASAKRTDSTNATMPLMIRPVAGHRIQENYISTIIKTLKVAMEQIFIQ